MASVCAPQANQTSRCYLGGFTLLELLVVLVILALLGGIVGPRVMNYLGGAKSGTANMQIKQFGQSLDLYKLDMGRFPTTQQGLKSLLEAPPDATYWNGSYLKDAKTLPKDPWNRDYIYVSPGQHNKKGYDLSSLGADGREGGEGEDKDLTNWQ